MMILQRKPHRSYREEIPDRLVGICVKMDEFCIQNDEFCMQNDEFCIQNDDLNANVQVYNRLCQLPAVWLRAVFRR